MTDGLRSAGFVTAPLTTAAQPAADVVGVDGCAGGWVAASRPGRRGEIHCRRIDTLAELFDGPARPSVVAVDVPIGLLEGGARQCDVEARRLLGPRRPSVFTPPLRPMLGAASHAEASAARRRLEGKGVAIQAWGIVPKIREVDRLLGDHPAWRSIVREAHPELCFFVLNGRRPLAASKKTPAGHARRVRLLRARFGSAVARALAQRRRLGCHADDILDAIVLLWTAERIQRGEAVSIPADPPRDACGLRMEMIV